MLVERIVGEGHGGVGGAGQHVGLARDADDVGRMAATGALGVVGVNGTAANRGDGVLDAAGFVERVGVKGNLHVVAIGHVECMVDSRRGGAPVLVDLQADGAGLDLLGQRTLVRAVALAGEAQVHGVFLGSLEHHRDVPGTRGGGDGVSAVGRPRAAADHGGHARVEGAVDLLRADEVDMCVQAACGKDEPLAGQGLGARANGHARGDAVHDVGVAGMADADDVAALNADVGLVDTRVVEHECVGDYQVQIAVGAGGGDGLAHAVAQRLAAAKLGLLAIGGQVALHLDDQVGIGQTNLVSDGGSVHGGVFIAVDRKCHG